jgi:hypothetical protein
MNSFNSNSVDTQGVIGAVAVVCAGTVAAEQAAEGDTMSSEVRVG